jgi:uncharacterized protein YjbJ (UPF0337 family)
MGERGTKDKLVGKVKEIVGKVSGNRRLTSEGRTDQAKGKAKDVIENASRRVRGVAGSLGKETRPRRRT